MKKLILVFFLTSMASAQNLSIQLTSPTRSAEYPSCSDILFSADASITDGTIRRVEFYANGTRIRSATREPYEFTWTSVPDGLYEVYAKVVDRENNEERTNSFWIFVGDVEPGNIIQNGEFHCSLAPWRLETYEGGEATIDLVPNLYLTDDSSGVAIDIQNAGNQFWSVQFMQPFKVQAGHTYVVWFTALADDAKDIAVHISKNYDDYAPLFTMDYTVDDLNEYGPFEFTAVEDDNNLMFKFILSGNTTSILLDAVKVYDQQWTDVEQVQTQTAASFELLQNYPNPFNPSTRIEYVLDSAGPVELSIFNILGETMFSTSRVAQAGHHSIEWNGVSMDGRLCPSGVYLYQLKTASGTLTRKMHLIR